jgi:hypothetical protein
MQYHHVVVTPNKIKWKEILEGSGGGVEALSRHLPAMTEENCDKSVDTRNGHPPATSQMHRCFCQIF